ncbi:hypothetical protein M409DRAFT_21154 [Zasmidium cellare ATCC 36951]|uniref:non-specific serine/threonine protein kinase n=1 Tax=Zasmidium cellare ATCC 36951 TaxID=1080233 RepID=A0A6A6CP15_ZASCE|nr:uncharacterized protein M409DRAFT_21154 [Zasmidium cellare ATCC 36951]KAF2168403.1 hypothetical protein M409DRAFT_21154 [Zasmidium cellare ATCC 36951]
MFGPPFGGMGGFGGPGMIDFDEVGVPRMRRRRQAANGFPQTLMEVREPDLGMPGMGMPGVHPYPMGQGPFGLPPILGASPQGMQFPFGIPPRYQMPQAGSPGIGQVFDPSRAERKQAGRGEQAPGRRHQIPGQPRAKYEKIKSLIPGGMSESISLIRSKDDGRLYIEKQVRTDGIYRKRTEAEVQTLKAVRGHPNLNKLVEYEVKANGICSIILEYCDGGALDARIAEIESHGHHFSEAGVWHVLLSVAKALPFMHTGVKDVERDQPDPDWDTIAHLDLKPQNIFLSSDRMENGQRRIVLADFGCAVTFSDIQNGGERERGQPCGTPGWYPPEGIAKKGYGTKTDIWMLGGTIQAICLLIKAPHRPALASPKPCGNRYSSALQSMVRDLTDDRLDKRPSARKVAGAAAHGLGVNLKK